MLLSLNKVERKDIVARAFQAVIASMVESTIEAGVAALEAQYRLQLANYVSLAAKRDTVAGIINSSLPSNVQDQISDGSVIAVFADLVRTGLIEFEVEWVVPLPEPTLEPTLEPTPVAPFDPHPPIDYFVPPAFDPHPPIDPSFVPPPFDPYPPSDRS